MSFIEREKMYSGRYENWSLKEIYAGWDNPSEEFIHHYIIDRLSRAETYEFPAVFDSYTEPLRLFIKNIRILPNQYIDFDTDYFNNPGSGDIKGVSLVHYLNILLRSYDNFPERKYFGSPNDFILQQGDKNKNPYKIFADPECLFFYMRTGIYWNLKQSTLKELEQLEVNIFSGVELNSSDEVGFKYKILFKKQRQSIPSDIFEISREKEIEENEQANRDRPYIPESVVLSWSGYDSDGSESVFNIDNPLDDAFEGDTENTWNVD
jgi:hypothetical protein